MRAAVPVLIEVASDIAEAAGLEGSLRINPLQRLVIFLAISQPRAGDKPRGVEVECGRSLDLLLLLVTLGQAFVFVAFVGACASIWSMHRGHVGVMRTQGVTAAVALIAALIAKAASGQPLQEVLLYVGVLLRRFAPPAVTENPQLKAQ
jgi:hypothetical protein